MRLEGERRSSRRLMCLAAGLLLPSLDAARRFRFSYYTFHVFLDLVDDQSSVRAAHLRSPIAAKHSAIAPSCVYLLRLGTNVTTDVHNW